MIDPLPNETTLGLSEIDYNDFKLDLEDFNSTRLLALALNSQQGVLNIPGTTTDFSRPQSIEEQNLQRLWRLQYRITDKVH